MELVFINGFKIRPDKDFAAYRKETVLVLLSDILGELDYRVITGDVSCDIASVEFDSRKAAPGTIFVCIKGFTVDGHSFAGMAAKAGASCVIVDKDREGFADEELISAVEGTSCAVVEVEGTTKALALTSAALAGHPERRMRVWGITGTKGKTTTAFMLRAILEQSGRPAGLIGTVCNIIGGEKIPAKHTTPESSEIFRMMNKMNDIGINDLVMEVSSQGLKLDRVYGIRYSAAAFTNLYEDHIAPNEHPDMEDYLMCKLKIFDSCDASFVNIDCDVAGRVIERASGNDKCITYGLNDKADIMAYDIRCERRGHVTGTGFSVRGFGLDGDYFVALPGRFNVYNALCAMGMAIYGGCPRDKIGQALSSISVPGRMQPVANKMGVNILVDYAHNAAALESALNTLRDYTEGRIITVFGCGGNRSVTRRFEMGEVSGKLSDYTVITSDNPRKEEPEAIINDIRTGIDKTDGKYEIVIDRSEAISKAIGMAGAGDTVLIAGKGHEDYQIFADKTIHFDDVEHAADAVQALENGV